MGGGAGALPVRSPAGERGAAASGAGAGGGGGGTNPVIKRPGRDGTGRESGGAGAGAAGRSVPLRSPSVPPQPVPPIPGAPPLPRLPGSRDAQLLRELEDEELGKLRGAAEGAGRQHDAEEDRGGGGLEAGGGDQAGRGDLLHQDLDHRPHHRDQLQDRGGVRGADGGRAALQELGEVGEREQDGVRAAAAEGRRAQDGLVQGDDQRRGAHPDDDSRRRRLHQGLRPGVTLR